jgi:hypothetical protein
MILRHARDLSDEAVFFLSTPCSKTNSTKLHGIVRSTKTDTATFYHRTKYSSPLHPTRPAEGDRTAVRCLSFTPPLPLVLSVCPQGMTSADDDVAAIEIKKHVQEQARRRDRDHENDTFDADLKKPEGEVQGHGVRVRSSGGFDQATYDIFQPF